MGFQSKNVVRHYSSQHPRNGEACLFLIFLGMIYYRHTKPSVWDRRIFLVWYASHFRRAR